MSHSMTRAGVFAAIVTIGLMVGGLMVRPIFPVDETRYLTVAWEMHQSGNWILPTLNGEAYHHKPPVLFWIINLLWAVFGVSQQVAMVVPFLAGFAVMCLTARLSTRLFPDQPDAPLLTVALLGGFLPFGIYTNLIMFDLLLTVAVLIGVTAIWDFFKTRHTKHVLVFAAAVGLGLLIKGPAVLLHMAPALLGVRYWMGADAPPTKSWLPKMLGGLLLGVAIALCWAIPAAFEGGHDFAQKIFYGQTTGRMVNAFDHKRPLYWYLTFVPLFVLPWVCSPALWTGIKTFFRDTRAAAVCNKKFLLLWLGVVFIAFSFISGKQVHYLLPLLPPLALVIAAGFFAAPVTLRKRDILPMLCGANILALLPVALHFFAEHLAAKAPQSVHLQDAFTAITVWPSVVVGVAIFGLVFLAQRGKVTALVSVSLAMVLLTGSAQLAVGNGVYRNYDLAPFGEVLQQNNTHPMAFAGTYHGEFGFLGQLQKPFDEIANDQIPTWFHTHPDGMVVLYTRSPDDFKKYDIIFTQPYRMTNYFMLLGPKGHEGANGGNSTPRPHGVTR